MKKILILSANPSDTGRLRLDEEVREIKAGLERSKNRDRFEIVSEWAVRPRDLQRALLDCEPQIVHFSGHGAGSDGLALENDDGKMQLVRAEALAELFRLCQANIECVLLNACYSQVQSESICQHINHVVGMTQSIGDRAAIKFAVGFYDALLAGRNYIDAFYFGRNSIDLAGIPESATPAILLRSDIEMESITESSTSILLSPDSGIYVGHPNIEDKCYQTILRPASLLRVRGPQLMGRTQILNRVIKRVRANRSDYRIAVINFRSRLGQEAFSTPDKFFQAFCVCISDLLRLSTDPNEYWHSRDGDPNHKATCFFEDFVLKTIDSPLVLFFNDIDRVFEHSVAQSFCDLLRGWYGEAQQEGRWEQIRLVIGHSTDFYASLNINNSPLANVGEVITLEEFTQQQVQDLTEHYGLNWNKDRVKRLMNLVGGHPYLIDEALKTIADQRSPLKDILDKAATEEGIYSDHLRQLWGITRYRPDLWKALRKVVIAPQPVRVNPLQLFHMNSLGLVKINGNEATPRCQLYRQYFSALPY
jgi:AAA-like domain/CHAT domain